MPLTGFDNINYFICTLLALETSIYVKNVFFSYLD